MTSMEREMGQLSQGFADIKEGMVSQNAVLKEQNVKLDAILTQAVKTNGRVSKLEFWRSAIIWGCGTILGLSGVAMPFFANVLTDRITDKVTEEVKETFRKEMRSEIDTVLSTYDLEEVK